MTRLTQRTLLAACTLVASMVLSACGGGEDTPIPSTPQSITFASPGDQVFATTPALLAATSTSGLSVAFASSTPAVCTVSAATLTLLGTGTCSLSANQAGNTTFLAAAPVTRSFSVLPAAQTITFISPGNQALGVTPVPLLATATSGLSVLLSSNTPSVCSVSSTTLSLAAVGTCTLSASQSGNTNYSAAAPVLHSFTVAAAMLAQTITFTSPGDLALGVTPAPLVATASSGLAVSLASTTPAVCTVSGSTLSLVSFGTCTVAASQAGNASFAAAAAVLKSFNVAAITQTISFTSPGGQTLGSATPALRASATSGLAVSFVSTTPAVCDAAGTTLTLVATGTCTVVASQAGNSTYAAAAPVSQSFGVAAAAQSITFTSPGTQTLGLTPAALVATSTSGLVVSFASGTPSVCTVSGTTLTLVAAGTCTVSASQPGNATFAAAATVTNSFTVAAVTQTITFPSPGNQTLGVTPAALVASASSGLAVSLSSATAAVCTVSGSTLTLMTAGTCTISANQAGNGAFAAATTVTHSFTSAIEYFANGGFETIGVTTPALAWLQAASGYSRSTDARSGGFSAQLASPAINAAVMLQNSVEQGVRPALTVGESPTLTFWAKGTAGGTGNVLFALRYLDGVGNIRANSFNRFFQAQINPTTWTKITYNLGVVPAGAVAAFIEFSHNIGPIDAGNPAGLVLIDDLSLRLP